jgi:aerobactin synthase
MSWEWEEANRNLIVKAISELYYEEVISNEVREIEKGSYILELNKGLSYTFKAYESIWCHLIIDAGSLKRSDGLELDAAKFFKETQPLTKMDDVILANFLEEMFHTLYSDQILLRNSISAEKMYQLDALEAETYLNGHPKIILNKGRIGWSPRDLSEFSPENNNKVKLCRVAIKKDLLTINHQKYISFNKIIHADIENKEIDSLREKFYEKKIKFDSYFIIPVHPWQWENKIRFFFQKDISKNIVFLSISGGSYKPHISLRTFSNCNNTYLCDIKLPISILNTSCVRGIPSRYISVASEISEGIESILKQDKFLLSLNIDCLKEIAAFSYVDSSYSDIQDAPYR